jgi:putative ABC transport system substrate-binding protein
MPVIGFLNPTTPEALAEPMRGLRQGLKDAGYVEGENLTIEYRWADNQAERLPAMAAELVRRRVSLIVATGGGQAPLAAKAATTALPIVFNTADDPVNLGLVASLAQPGGNVTGVSILSTELTAKRLELLHALAPNAIRIAVFINPGEPASDVAMRELEAAGVAIGLQTRILRTSTGREIDAAFASFVHERPDALFFAGSALFFEPARSTQPPISSLEKSKMNAALIEGIAHAMWMSDPRVNVVEWRVTCSCGIYTALWRQLQCTKGKKQDPFLANLT